MPTVRFHRLLSGVAVTSLGTLVSRVAGLARDIATAALFGLAAGGVMDAFVVAFRVPNLFRRLFGEGAMTASYLPIFAQAVQRDRRQAWVLASTTVVWLARFLAILVILGEAAVVAWAWFAKESEHGKLLAGLTATMLPYLVLVCLAALASATLQALGRFATPAFAPAILNLCWLAGAVIVAPLVSSEPATQAYVLAVSVLIGGLLQWLVQVPALRREGFRFEVDFAASRNQLSQIRRDMIPTALGLAVTQINTLLDSLIAWMLSAPSEGPKTIAWLGGVAYPMQQGAAAAIYFGERFYQFPLGLLGLAVATVVFPMLSSHAARGDYPAVASDLTLGLRMVWMTAIPCSIGLILLAEPIARMLFQRGQFTPQDTLRTARMIAVYGAGVWAYCASPVLVRAFYALGDRITPLRVALVAVGLNLLLNLTLIWPLAEAGLAAATAITATVQTALLAVLFSQNHVRLDWRRLSGTLIKATVSAAVMGLVGWLLLNQCPHTPGTFSAVIRLAVPLAACLATYALAMALIGRRELRELFWRR